MKISLTAAREKKVDKQRLAESVGDIASHTHTHLRTTPRRHGSELMSSEVVQGKRVPSRFGSRLLSQGATLPLTSVVFVILLSDVDPPLNFVWLLLVSQDAKCSLCVGLISLAVVAALVLEKLVSGQNLAVSLGAKAAFLSELA